MPLALSEETLLVPKHLALGRRLGESLTFKMKDPSTKQIFVKNYSDTRGILLKMVSHFNKGASMV